MRIIITGGAGFIGSHIADAYLAAGHEVVVVDSLWAHGGGRRDNLPEKASFIHLDIRDPGIERVFRDFAPDVVSHHAAQHSVAISSRDPQLDAQINVLGLINVLDNCVKAKVKKVLFASSGATFGEPDKLPANEATPQRPESPYAITKMVAEHYLRFYKAQHGLDFTALRYGNVYGPRQDPNGEAGVISIFIGKFLAHQGIKIFWDGEQTRDYVYVGDIADRVMRSAPERRRASTRSIARSPRSRASRHRSNGTNGARATCATRSSIRRSRKPNSAGKRPRRSSRACVKRSTISASA
jgi:UDP-glucose 4-epimerase